MFKLLKFRVKCFQIFPPLVKMFPKFFLKEKKLLRRETTCLSMVRKKFKDLFNGIKKKINLFYWSLIYHYYLISYPLIKDVADVIKTVRDLTTPLLHQHKQSFDQNNLRLHFLDYEKHYFFPQNSHFLILWYFRLWILLQFHPELCRQRNNF